MDPFSALLSLSLPRALVIGAMITMVFPTGSYVFYRTEPALFASVDVFRFTLMSSWHILPYFIQCFLGTAYIIIDDDVKTPDDKTYMQLAACCFMSACFVHVASYVTLTGMFMFGSSSIIPFHVSMVLLLFVQIFVANYAKRDAERKGTIQTKDELPP